MTNYTISVCKTMGLGSHGTEVFRPGDKVKLAEELHAVCSWMKETQQASEHELALRHLDLEATVRAIRGF